MTDHDLPHLIDELFTQGDKAEPRRPRGAFVGAARDAVGDGTVRAAEPDASSPTGWRVNAWVKKGILLGFRCGRLSDQSMDHGRLALCRQGHACR